MYKKIQQQLIEIENNNLLRKLENIDYSNGKYIYCEGKKFLNFSSNDYLNLANSPEILESLYIGAKKYGVGARGSQLITGRTEAHKILEVEFAKFLGFEKALIFPSGFSANLGVLNALLDRNSVAFLDKLNHASIIDGALLSRAKLLRYKHLCLDTLENYLDKFSVIENKLIMTESIFSMEGTLAPIDKISTLAKKYDALTIVDDAHAIGILGNNGKGSLDHFNLSSEDIDVLICPLGKAFAGMGAVVLTNNIIYKYLLQFARSFMYSTGISPALVSGNLQALELIKNSDSKRENLFSLVNYFRKKAADLGLLIGNGNLPIQNIFLFGANKAVEVSNKLRSKGIWLTAIRPPSVPLNTSRLRVTITAAHETEDIDFLLTNLAEIVNYDFNSNS